LASYEADEWLDRARANGLAARFTIPGSGRDLRWPQSSMSLPTML
jgi:hypothetical protein